VIEEAITNTNVLVISAQEEQQVVLRLLKAGVKGFITKACSQSEVLDAVEKVASGKKFFCAAVLDMLVNQGEGDQEKGHDKQLSNREIEVLKLIAEGNMTKEIAELLNLSYHTINSHRKNIIKKLGAKSSTELIISAINMGLISTRSN